MIDFLRGVRLDCLLLSLPAGVFWLWYVWGKARLHPPPPLLVGVAFVLGALSPLGVVTVDQYVNTHPIPVVSSLSLQQGSLVALLYFVVLVGLVEETSKMLSVRCSVYYSRTFDDPLHGVVYSSAAALGFATVENARYVDAHGAEVLIGRAIMSTFGHVLLSMVWGFAIGAQRTRPRAGLRGFVAGWSLLLAALLLAAALHGVYDFFLFEGFMGLALLLLFTLWRVFVAQTEFVRHHSPHRRTVARRLRECGSCHALVREEGHFCGGCGVPMPVEGPCFCAACGRTVAVADATCPTCRLLLR